MSKRILWVVEVRLEDLGPDFGWGEWFPDLGTYLTRKDAVSAASVCDDGEQTRVRKYEPSRAHEGK